MRKLIGKNPYTIFAIIGLVALQITVAGLVANQSWWWVFGAAYFVGAFADHSLFVMIHECTHQLLFKSRSANRWASMMANLPQIFPSAISFEHFHLKHHSFQGIHELDADLPSNWEAKLINNSFLGKALWLLFFPLFQFFRLPRLKEIKSFDRWTVINLLIQIVFTAAIYYFFGWHGLAYYFSFRASIRISALKSRSTDGRYLSKASVCSLAAYCSLKK